MAHDIVCSREIHPEGGGRFILGRSEECVGRLAVDHTQKVQLIYLDPPFGTGSSFSADSAPAYRDKLKPDEQIQLMRTVLTGCRELLSPTGAIYLHIDYRLGADMKLLMDEIFGRENFVNEIIWSYRSGGRAKNHFSRKHDTILFYRKTKDMYFNIEAVGAPRGPERRNHMKRELDQDGRVYYTICTGGKTYAYYEDSPIYPSDVWDDIEHLHQRDPERTGYDTQKPLALLKRIILASSREGDTVIDLFCGSGTTADAADRLNRSWIAVDSSAASLVSLRKRMIKARSEATLFSGISSMTLDYPGLPRAETVPDISIEHKGSRVRAELRSFSGAQPVYLALGTADGDTFSPLACSLSPRRGTALSAVCPGPPVVQICEANGNSSFIQFD